MLPILEEKVLSNKRVGSAIIQHLESYIRNRNNPDSEITCRHISQSNKAATEKRSKYLSHNKDGYFQRALQMHILLAAAAQP